MWTFAVVRQGGNSWGEVRKEQLRWLVIDTVGGFLVNLSNRAILDRLGLYQLGSWLIKAAHSRYELVTRVYLTEDVLAALDWDWWEA